MLDIFLDAVLPVFAVVAAGYGFGRTALFDEAQAAAINRFVFFLALPLLLFRLIASAPLDQFEWLLIAVYLLVESLLYALGFAIARLVFHRSRTESLLLGMASMFPNHVYFVLPIARVVFGEEAVAPIVALITVDAVLLFCGTILILDATSETARGASLLRVSGLMLRNPQILALGAGLACNLAGLELTGGVELFTRFLGECAAPCSLFALGVILCVQKSRLGPVLPATMSAIKLAIVPLIMWFALTSMVTFDSHWTAQALLVAAGPTGAMPFVLALQYKVPTDAIARIVLLTTIGALVSVTFIAQFA